MSGADGHHDHAELVALLAATVGEDTARREVDAAATAIGAGGSRYSREQALRVLERVAQQPGLVGITARLAKSRLRAQRLVEGVR